MIYDKNTQADASSPKKSPEQFWQLKLTIIGGSHPPLGTNNDGGGRIIPPGATSKRQGPAPLSPPPRDNWASPKPLSGSVLDYQGSYNDFDDDHDDDTDDDNDDEAIWLWWWYWW